MTRRVFSIAVSICVLALMTATAFAQLSGEPVRVNIPFDFSVRGRSLPAGEYQISRVGDETEVLAITNTRHLGDHALVQTDTVQRATAKGGELVFHRYGDFYFLHEIWTPGLETGREIPTSRQEKMLRRETASTGESAEPQTVALAIY